MSPSNKTGNERREKRRRADSESDGFTNEEY